MRAYNRVRVLQGVGKSFKVGSSDLSGKVEGKASGVRVSSPRNVSDEEK